MTSGRNENTCACGRAVHVRKTGECSRCYQRRYHRQHYTRRTPAPSRPPAEVAARFWERVTPYGDNGCWLWLGRHNDGGYGKFYESTNRPDRMAHRYAWEERYGPIPDGLDLDHTCTRPACVNPEHLDPVTPAENNRRSRERRQAGEYRTHCAEGHELSAENTHRIAGGRTVCRQCQRANDRARRAGRGHCPDCGANRARSSMARHRRLHGETHTTERRHQQ